MLRPKNTSKLAQIKTKLSHILFAKNISIGTLNFSYWDLLILSGVTYYIFTNNINNIYQFAILLIAIIIHEVAHGYIALKLGDPTAKNANRLTLNPLAHLDPIGSIIVPGILLISGSPFFIGWAKPVPINPQFFKHTYRDLMLVAIAGPISNIALMLLSILLLKCIIFFNPPALPVVLLTLKLCQFSIVINFILAIFNLIPIPPLDGSRILMYVLPQSIRQLYQQLEPYGMPIIIICALLGVFSWLFSWLFYFLSALLSILF